MIETVLFDNDAVVILDQSKLPGEVVFESCHTPQEVADAIRSMKVRGAPLIGVVAAFGMALGMRCFNGSAAELDDYFYNIN